MASSVSKGPSISIRTRDDSADSQKSPRAARFAEATSVDSPIDAPIGGFRFNETPYTPVESCKPQLQAGDIGFGYINDRRSMAEVPHVEMPASEHDIQALPVSPGPKSPLKSAMKSPRTRKPAGLDLPLKSPTFQQPLKSPLFQEEAILSPTWREEKLLERRETRTSKRQQEDLVSLTKLTLTLQTDDSSAASQNTCSHGQTHTPIHKLLLQSHRPCYGWHCYYRLRIIEKPASTQRPPTLGARYPTLASDYRPLHRMCIISLLNCHSPRILQEGQEESREVGSILLNHGRGLFRCQHCHVGYWC